MNKKVGVGTHVFVKKDNKILMSKRIGSHGAGTWQLCGGHIEFGETYKECAKREVFEETNLIVKNLKFLSITEEFYPELDKHYITIFLSADYKSGELVNKEPHKAQDLGWFDFNNMPKPLFPAIENLFKVKTLKEWLL